MKILRAHEIAISYIISSGKFEPGLLKNTETWQTKRHINDKTKGG